MHDLILLVLFYSLFKVHKRWNIFFNFQEDLEKTGKSVDVEKAEKSIDLPINEGDVNRANKEDGKYDVHVNNGDEKQQDVGENFFFHRTDYSVKID